MARTATQQEIVIEAADDVRLSGTLSMPHELIGTAIFAHGSGSGRLSPRNQSVAHSLVDRGCATLLFDLLTEEESRDRRNVFDIGLLSERMMQAAALAMEREELRRHPVGFFGASTGAAAALVAAAKRGSDIAAVVSRGGRPDLADAFLPRVSAPTLLIVGSLDHEVIELNRVAQRKLRCENRLEIVPGASHLFEEPGTLEEVSRLAGEWFVHSFTDV